MVDSFDSAVVAMQQINMWDCVTVGFGGLEGLKTDQISIVPVSYWLKLSCDFKLYSQATPSVE